MQPGNELVTIVTPAFNAAQFIETTIASAQAQTYTNWEMIVVDDASTDDTLERLRAAASGDSRIRLVCQASNQGIAAARNAALENASGGLIAFLDSDDLWESTKLERQIAFMRETHASFVFSAYRLISETGQPLGDVRCEAAKIRYQDMLSGHRVGCLTVVLDRRVLTGLRFPLFRKASDLALWLEVLRAGNVAHGMADTLASYRVLPRSISRNKAKYVGDVWDIYRTQPIGFANAARYYAQYAVRGIVKHFSSGAYRIKPA